MKNILIATMAIVLFSGCTKGCNKGESASQDQSQPAAQTAAAGGEQAPAPKVEIEDTVVGKGDVAENGKTITVHYTGTLKDGTQFDSSVERKEPFSFNLGSGQVIKGWEQGILGMKVGGKRKLTIPPELAYGNNAVGAIPANSVLIFTVELLGVK